MREINTEDKGEQGINRQTERGVNSVNGNKRGSLQSSLQSGTQVTEATVHTVGQCKPRNYLWKHVTALVLRWDLSRGFGPVDVPPHIRDYTFSPSHLM